jgi:hypothetical protein
MCDGEEKISKMRKERTNARKKGSGKEIVHRLESGDEHRNKLGRLH